jgi:hypothetical protein
MLLSRFTLTDVEAENIRMGARIEEANSPRDQLLKSSMILKRRKAGPGFPLRDRLHHGTPPRARIGHETWSAPTSCSDGYARFQTQDGLTRRISGRDGEGHSKDRPTRPLVRFAATLHSRPELNLTALTRFLVLLGSPAAPTLCDLLGETGDRRLRRALCEALAISCKNNVDLLIHRLWDPRWFVVRNLLYVLGRIGHHGVERALGEALYHQDVRVRREAVRALGGIDSPVSRAYLNSALRDPDRSVRILVAQRVVKRVDERSAQILWSVIESPEFVGRDAEERTTFFVALGRAGSDVLVPRLEKILTRGGLAVRARRADARRRRWRSRGRHAGSGAVLNCEVRSMREEVRRAVEQALEVRRAGEGHKG